MSLDTPAPDALLAPLLNCGPIKVWSVVVTLLGDSCRTPQDQLSGRDMDRMLAPLGINNQALRVALHRLKRDGLVEAQKQGRTSTYRLSATGWQMTEAVRPRIYQSPDSEAPLDTPIWIAIAPPDLTSQQVEAALPDHALRLSPKSAMIAGALPDLHGGLHNWLITPHAPEETPDWVRKALSNPQLIAGYDTLRSALMTACPSVADAQALPQDSQHALRLLALHHWRRLRLRHGALQDILLGDHWPGAMARRQVHDLLDALPRAEPS